MRLKVRPQHEMILEVATDTGDVRQHINLALAKVIRRSNPREHQQLRRIHGAGTHDDFAARRDFVRRSVGGHVLDATRPRFVEQDACHERPGSGIKVASLFKNGCQERSRRAKTFAILDRVLIEARNPVLLLAVEVPLIVLRQAELLGCVEKGVAKLIADRRVRDIELSRRSVELILNGFV